MKALYAAILILAPLPAYAQPPPAPAAAQASPSPAAPPEPASLPPATPAPAEGPDVVKTTDGVVFVGKVLRETATGYLFRTGDGQTLVIEFTRIADIQSQKDRPSPALPAAGAPAAPGPAPQAPSPAPQAPDRTAASAARLKLLDEEITRLNGSYRSQFNAGLGLGSGLLFVGIGAVGLGCCTDNNPSVKTTSVVALVTGGVLAIVGGIMLGVNASHNSGVDAEIRKLELEQKTLKQEGARGTDALGTEPQLALSLFSYTASF